MDDLFAGVTEKVEKSVIPTANVTKKSTPKKKPVAKVVSKKKSATKKVVAREVMPAGEIKIEKGIPIPTPRKKYPFFTMKVGESFFSDKPGVANLSSIHSRKGKEKFTCRKVEGGWRVWRVS
jgi:hypothetical protein